MTLLAEIGEALRGAISDDVFPSATLHVATEAEGTDLVVTRTFVDHGTQGFVSDWKAEIRLARGYDANVAKIVLVQSPSLPKPKVGDEVSAQRPINGNTERYRVTDVTSDPADATYQVAGVKV